MITKGCLQCGKSFECGKGTRKSVTDKFCGVKCAEEFYKDCPSLPPPPGCNI